jgi:hypothetical protein
MPIAKRARPLPKTQVKRQKGKPSRSEAIRRLIEFALPAKSKKRSSKQSLTIDAQCPSSQAVISVASHLSSLNAPWLFRVRDPYFLLLMEPLIVRLGSNVYNIIRRYTRQRNMAHAHQYRNR